MDNSFSSDQLIGKPTMINFWFTRCAPCIDEMPVLNKIKEKYKDDFNFIAITYEKKEDVEKYKDYTIYDNFYVKKRSLKLDILILCKTLKLIILFKFLNERKNITSEKLNIK